MRGSGEKERVEGENVIKEMTRKEEGARRGREVK